jgi:hypothetical protein
LQNQPGQVCQAGQVHKIRKTNFVDLHDITYDFKIHEKFSKIQMIKISEENLNFLKLPQNFHAKRQGGEG